jgi:diguanylate cyclase (GGDEF)-like protein
VGVFFIDIDQFKHINDTLGHDVGDEVLRQVALRFRQSLRETDTLARQSGDEFVAVVEVKRRHDLVTIAESLLHQLKTPIKLPTGEELFITASIGISASPADGSDAHTLLRNADRAMYAAKAEGRDTHRFYSARLRDAHAVPVLFASGLRRAVERSELILHFQPIVNLRERAIDGMEALVRWQHPSRGLLPPLEFIPLAEESGLILSIERWVLYSAMTEARRVGPARGLKLSINVSTRHFDQPTLLAELKNLTKQAGFDPRLLELELTESGIMHHPRRVLRHLKGLRRLGIRVAIDDFGTGYSCLGLMKRFPLNALKIDRSFVSNCETDHTSRTLVAAVIRMGHALGLEVTAEGVETAGQLAYLLEQGCDRGQGSFFSQPVPATDLLSFLEMGLNTAWPRRSDPRPGKGTKPH